MTIHEQKPLILITNDDGIESPGLLAAAEAVAPLGQLLIVAPHHQQTGAGRSFPNLTDRRIYHHTLTVAGEKVTAYSIKGSPAQVTGIALFDLADRPASLVISGINFGENIGSGITASGTVGAAIEAAIVGLPALAVSRETPVEYYTTHSTAVDFSTAAYFVHHFAQKALNGFRFPFDVDVLKIDVPASATPHTDWRVTRISRQAYHYPLASSQDNRGLIVDAGFDTRINYDTLEPDSDIYAVIVDRVVSVAPLSINLSSRIQPEALQTMLLTSVRDSMPTVL